MNHRNLGAQKKPPRSPAGNLEGVNRDLEAPATVPEWSGRGKAFLDPAASPIPPPIPAGPCSDATTDPVFYTRKTLCRLIQVSERTWSRAAAQGLTPQPDILIGREARWSPSTIQRWLRSKPRFPGRRGGGA